MRCNRLLPWRKLSGLESGPFAWSVILGKLFVLCGAGNFEPSGSRKLPKPGRVEEEGKENTGG